MNYNHIKPGAFVSVIPEIWRNPPTIEFCSLVERLLCASIQKPSVLLVGTGSTREQYNSWPEALSASGCGPIEYLEIYEPYLHQQFIGKWPVTLGDACDLSATFESRTFDICLWIQGPEHTTVDKMVRAAMSLFKHCTHFSMMTSPYGNYYNGQEHISSNDYEPHMQKNITLESWAPLTEIGWLVKTFGVKDAPNASICAWKVRGESIG